MFYKRSYENLENYIKSGQVLVIYGSRQVGKTTLINNFLKRTRLKYKLDNGDNILTRQIFESDNFGQLTEYVSSYDLLVIDEAQRIPNIGFGLKILVDQVPNLKIIVTGSSSFELSGQIGEPLTGRKRTLTMYPLSQLELQSEFNAFELKANLDQYLIYGSYPKVVTEKTNVEKTLAIQEITNSYLLKDVLELDKIKNSKVLLDLLKMLAFQIGSEVSINELATKVKLDVKTVAKYLDVLEKSFVIYNLRGFSKNLRNEITKKSKYYFYDLGIRNTIISNYNDLETRNDIGGLWENFMVIERLKKQEYTPIFCNNYFWRTWDGAEVDWIEEREGKIFGYEFKNTKNKQVINPKFLQTYPEAVTEIIDRSNYLEWVGR